MSHHPEVDPVTAYDDLSAIFHRIGALEEAGPGHYSKLIRQLAAYAASRVTPLICDSSRNRVRQ